MKTILILLTTIITIVCTGQNPILSVDAKNDSLTYKRPRLNSPRGFYSTYSNFLLGRLSHSGPFTVSTDIVKCQRRDGCVFSNLKLTSEVKAMILPIEVKYLYDGRDLFMIFKTRPFGFGNHIEVCLVQNQGRYGFFERLVANKTPGLSPESHYFIVDLESEIVYKPSKKKLTLIFKDNPDLLTEYYNGKNKLKLPQYVIKLNRKMGYLKENEK